ncbi:hypothetical protein J6590_043306 [Homalodisca vitripennis]|nr:hypothetical protein J6590_043306 [Homalodisca vitripennis]
MEMVRIQTAVTVAQKRRTICVIKGLQRKTIIRLLHELKELGPNTIQQTIRSATTNSDKRS